MEILNIILEILPKSSSLPVLKSNFKETSNMLLNGKYIATLPMLFWDAKQSLTIIASTFQTPIFNFFPMG